MSLLQEAVLDRLWTKYEHRFGHPPPIETAGFDEAIAILRKVLAEPQAQPSGMAPHCIEDSAQEEVFGPVWMSHLATPAPPTSLGNPLQC